MHLPFSDSEPREGVKRHATADGGVSGITRKLGCKL